MPSERALTDEEQDEIQEAAVAALERLEVGSDDALALVRAIEARIVSRRATPSDHNRDVFQLGALFGHCVAEALGWELVSITWATFHAHAAATMDRSLVILPFLAVAQLYDDNAAVPGLSTSFERLLAGELPPGLERGGYAVLLPR